MAKSIMHNKQDRTCYLCILLNGDYATHSSLQEHHVMPGTANRRLSERWGLKVYLCIQHHTAGNSAVHNNADIQHQLQRKAQEVFEAEYSHQQWMQVFGRNYI